MTVLNHTCHALVLELPTGRFTWLSYRLVPGITPRTPERLERWEGRCASCEHTFVVLARLAGGDRQRYFERRGRGEADVVLRVEERLYPQLVAECRKCREAVPA